MRPTLVIMVRICSVFLEVLNPLTLSSIISMDKTGKYYEILDHE